jgi:hypothetical protein
MSRDISATNQAEVDASHLHEVVLVKLDWDEPAYVHSGFGSIVWDGNTYIGTGGLGGISEARESELLGPASLTLTLSGVDATFIATALDTVSFGDAITIYLGYRQDDGTLVDDPWIVWSGWFEFASIAQAAESEISIICQHDLSVLSEIDGSKFTDEDQQEDYSGDVFFEHVHEMQTLAQKLLWAGRAGWSGGGGGRGGSGSYMYGGSFAINTWKEEADPNPPDAHR